MSFGELQKLESTVFLSVQSAPVRTSTPLLQRGCVGQRSTARHHCFGLRRAGSCPGLPGLLLSDEKRVHDFEWVC
jgi:hypothetical protein